MPTDKPEQVVQHYHASMIALSLDGYSIAAVYKAQGTRVIRLLVAVALGILACTDQAIRLACWRSSMFFFERPLYLVVSAIWWNFKTKSFAVGYSPISTLRGLPFPPTGSTSLLFNQLPIKSNHFQGITTRYLNELHDWSSLSFLSKPQLIFMKRWR
ncbi:hypothetical protein Hypma_005112 [Hypsizygus marmoreus]|uniref:Uncharacterized protein n=1 Tax=Hypsizygus marmoreus TaxID=39966 RepID=A0A369JXD8_HYPMA|nr:hypothetical protein Hypma_005112 [Hypsizygus marmoreus]